MKLGFREVPFQKASDIIVPESYLARMTTGNETIDAMFGGGIVRGSTIVLHSRQGIGKSTFTLSLANSLIENGQRVAYSSGEEHIYQLTITANRLGLNSVEIGTITSVEKLMEYMESLDFLVIDSYQTLRSEKVFTSERKKVTYFNNELVKKAKETGCVLCLIAQELPSGIIRGGNTILYAVDVNMRILDDGDNRIFDIYKNRCGPTTQYYAKFGGNGYEFIGDKDAYTKIQIEKLESTLLDSGSNLFTVKIVAEYLDISDKHAKCVIQQLERDGSLLRYGRGAETIWRLNKQKSQSLSNWLLNFFH